MLDPRKVLDLVDDLWESRDKIIASVDFVWEHRAAASGLTPARAGVAAR